MKEVIVNISTDGSFSIEVNGVKGDTCHDLTKRIESAFDSPKVIVNKGVEEPQQHVSL